MIRAEVLNSVSHPPLHESPFHPHYQQSHTPAAYTMDVLTRAFSDEYLAQGTETLTAEQSYFTWLSKNTGRGFKILSAASGEQLFTVQSQNWGKRRSIQAGTSSSDQGAELCELTRNWTQRKGAWQLVVGGKQIMSVNAEWSKVRIRFTATVHDPETGETHQDALVAEASDVWGGQFLVRAGESNVLGVKCQNMKEGWLSAFKVTPPTWQVEVAKGTNLILATVIAVCISDAFSESHGFMV